MRTSWIHVLAASVSLALFNPASSSAQQPAWTVIGWRVSIQANCFRGDTTFNAIDKASAIGVKFIEGSAGMKVSTEIPKDFDWNLTDAELAMVQQKLHSAGLTMPTYYAPQIPSDDDGIRHLFRFAKTMGVETIISEPPKTKLEFIDKVANEDGINVALLDSSRSASSAYSNPKSELQLLAGRSKRIGLCPDIRNWMQENINPIAGLRLVKDRVLSLHLSDWSGVEASSQPVSLGSGNAKLREFLQEVYKLDLKPTVLAIDESFNSPDSTEEITRSVAFLNGMVTMVVGEKMDEVSKNTPIRWQVTPEERQKIAAAIPVKAQVKPKKPRKLLVVDLNAAYGGHHSIPYANVALQLMGKQTGAFEPVFSNDLSNLRWEKLRHYDALYLNNTVGPIFNAADLREGLLRYVREGGGLVGHHGTSRASLDWPEFGEMLGAHSGPHGARFEKVTVKIDDPTSPINAAFDGKSFELTDEFFRFRTPPYSREKLHILLSFDVAKTDMHQVSDCAGCIRADNDYAISWIRSYGRGRVFFCSLGNSPSTFWSPTLLAHFLAGIQFALGDLDADTTPSAKLPHAEVTAK